MPNHTSRGGYIKDLPRPHRRYWPESKDKRAVKVKFLDWSASVGGSHTSLTITEEHNYIWDEREQLWREAWDDDKGSGFEIRTKFERYEQALEVARAIVAIMFPPETHEVRWDGIRKTRHRYARQSD